MRRILLISGFILVSIAIGVAIYFVFFRGLINPPTNNAGNANVPVNGGFPNANANVNRPVSNGNANVSIANRNVNAITNAGLPKIDTVARGGKTLTNRVTDDMANGATLSADGKKIRYYDRSTGKFYEISADGKTKKELTDQVFPEADNVAWSPRENKAIVTFPDGSKILYDFDKKQQVTLPKEWDSVEFSTDGSQVAFKNLVENTDDRWLGIANPDGSGVQYIEPIGNKEADVQVAWSPSSQVVALYREGASASSQEVYFIGLHGENLKSLQTDGRGFQGAWSPDGDKLLYSVYNSGSNYNPTLWITNASGDNIGMNNTSLQINTWPSKCAFGGDGSSVYCAVPNNLSEGSGLYPETANSVADTFYKIDLTSGQQTVLAQPVNSSGTGSYTASDVMLSPDGSFIYFTDIQTGRVYKIQIK